VLLEKFLDFSLIAIYNIRIEIEKREGSQADSATMQNPKDCQEKKSMKEQRPSNNDL
jgi:hypothetical protein